ncbi:MAG: C-terminal binding protein [Chloroflexota bacterium]|nr:C-terminal binding protein [Chloroflexota bacterium]
MGLKVVHTLFMPGAMSSHEELLADLGVEVVKMMCRNEDEIIAAVCDADGVMAIGGAIVPDYRFSRRVIENLAKCRIIACLGIGYDTIDVSAATEYGIYVTNVPDYCLDEVSDHTMMLILACARKLYRILPEVKSGKWISSAEGMQLLRPLHRLRGQTLGLIGFGSIARTLALKSKAFGLKIIAFDPNVPHTMFKVFGVEAVELDRLLKEADFISVHAALTTENKKLIGLEQFKKMKPTTHLINTARGELIDEQALYTALSQGLIAGAGIDVTAVEPCSPDNPLFQLNNIFITGHSAHYSEESQIELYRHPWEEVARVLHGGLPQALVNPQVKENFLARWAK